LKKEIELYVDGEKREVDPEKVQEFIGIVSRGICPLCNRYFILAEKKGRERNYWCPKCALVVSFRGDR